MTLARTPPDALAADAARIIARREERAISWLRAIGGVVAIALVPMFDAPLPGGGRVLAQLLAAAASVTGVIGLRVLGREISAHRLLRFRMLSLGSDAVITLLFTTLYAEQPALGLFMLALPVQGAMKLGAPGALAITGLSATSGVVAQVLRTTFGGTTWDSTLAWGTALPGLGFGLMVTFLATTRGMETLETLRLARDLSAHRAAGQVVHAAASTETVTADAAHALLEAAGARTRVDMAVLLDLREVEPRELTAWVRPGSARNRDVRVDADGPTARAAATGQPVYSGPDEPIAYRGLAGGRALAAIPVMTGGGVTAVLIGETSDPAGILPGCIAELRQTADQLSLIFGLAHVRDQRDVLEREIAELEGARDQVLAIGSHELRTPLTTILGFSELMATHGESMSSVDVVRFGRALNRASLRLQRTLEDVQFADNLRRGVLTVAVETVELGPLASGVAELWPGTLVRTGGRVRVCADATHLRTVIERLVDNAWEHGGGIDVEVSWTVLGDRAVLTVADGGPGMDATGRVELTAPFAQAQDVLAHQRGTGLGLTIARGLSVAMRADLVLADSGAKGTRWEIWLPVVTAVTDDRGGPPGASRASGTERRTKGRQTAPPRPLDLH